MTAAHNRLRIAILFGGSSAEHDVILRNTTPFRYSSPAKANGWRAVSRKVA